MSADSDRVAELEELRAEDARKLIEMCEHVGTLLSMAGRSVLQKQAALELDQAAEAFKAIAEAARKALATVG